ncbi:hypothetical protein NLI96_g1628 [Meripilus lineatus]|uniref:Carbohydrate-binding module family 19 domain-containing protein n=1 Tax=Meripilus lineatus TaxID=2056292 RepID=A0AAD5VBQ4_9APHY|nr:hypothetical protein NLI96_g1628 [Physisporinus lineatus]
MKSSVLLALVSALAVTARPSFSSRAASPDVLLKNGQDAIALNNKFKTLSSGSSCSSGENACVDNGFAQCSNGKFLIQPCGPGLICAALPLVNSAGTSIACTTQADLDARLAATKATSGSTDTSEASSAASASPTPINNQGKGGAAGNNNKGGNKNGNGKTGNNDAGGGDPQTSRTLVDAVIAKGFENDGQDQPAAGQVASLTSSNNFINFCATVPDLPITNGKQIKTGSCNPAPMGVIAASSNIPSAKFQFPTNLAEIEPNSAFTIKIAFKHLETGHFTNAQQTYYAAPQVVNDAGDIRGHSHVVVEKLNSLTQTEPTNPNNFAFFKGLNDGGNVLTADVSGGLPEGVYRLSSINTAANHQPCLVAVAQHGSIDDAVYFTVKKGAKKGGKKN